MFSERHKEDSVSLLLIGPAPPLARPIRDTLVIAMTTAAPRLTAESIKAAGIAAGEAAVAEGKQLDPGDDGLDDGAAGGGEPAVAESELSWESCSQAAYESLGSLTKAEITEVRSFSKPPALVIHVMTAVLVVLDGAASKQQPNWSAAKRLLCNPKLLRKLREFDPDSASRLAKKRKRLAQLVAGGKSGQPVSVVDVKKTSVAAAGLWLWVLAVNEYWQGLP